MKSQNDQILEALKSGETLTPLEILQRFGSMRAAARINDLRALGHNIVNLEKTGQFARYKWIAPQTIELPPAFKPVEQTQATLL